MNTTARTAAALAVVSIASPAYAADLFVDPSDNLQSVVSGAQSGDVIYLEDGTYPASLTITKDLTFVGEGWNTELSGSGQNTVFTVMSGTSLTLVDLALVNGGGHAALFSYGSVIMDGVSVTNNHTLYGAAFNAGQMSVVGDSIFQNNSTVATSPMAGAINNIGNLIVDNTTFLSNQGHNGGALANLQGVAVITDSSFTGNQAYLGGAVHNNNGQMSIEDSSFSTNFADSIGGAWSNHNLGGTVTTSGVGYAANSTGSGNFLDYYDVREVYGL